MSVRAGNQIFLRGQVGAAQGHALYRFVPGDDRVKIARGDFARGDVGPRGGAVAQGHRLGLLFLARGGVEQGELALLAIEGGEDFVGAPGLVPVDVAGVRRLFVEALGGVTVEDGAAERGAGDAVAVAPAGDVAAGEDELELAAGLAGVERIGRHVAWFA